MLECKNILHIQVLLTTSGNSAPANTHAMALKRNRKNESKKQRRGKQKLNNNIN